MDTSTLVNLLIGLGTAFACVAGTAWIAGKQWQHVSDRMDGLDGKMDDLAMDVRNIKENHIHHLQGDITDIKERLARMEGWTKYPANPNGTCPGDKTVEGNWEMG